MEGLGIFIMLCFGITFGPPVLLVIISLAKRKTNKQASKWFLILGIVWLIIGGGACLSILTGA
jgi:uncharacterized membrane protein